MPLILDANGNKFGKSEGNALWLDKNKTSSYKLYQYLINADDGKVEEYLKVFTFLSKEEIEDVMKKHNEKPEDRIAQRTLAKEFITDLHGKEEYEKAERISRALFTDEIYTLSKDDILGALEGVPTFNLNDGETILDLLINNNICSSRREAREFLTAGAIKVNNKAINDENEIISLDKLIDNSILILKKGKKNYFIGVYNK
jgi:tyrosyl-tRNA synthetase